MEINLKMSSENETQTTESSKEDFVKWNAAVNLHAAGEYQEALQLYHSMHDITARIYYNMAAAYINVGDIQVAIKCLTSAVRKDKGLAIAFFQRGTLHLECENTKDAISDLETTRMLFRGNTFINYRPLGLFCYLHDFAILYNLALAHLLEGDDEMFRMLMTEATHNADHFQREQLSATMILFKKKRWSEIQPINITTDAVFVPPKQVTKNLERKKSSKRSKVVFASDEKDNTPTFQGVQRLEELRRSLTQSRNLRDHQTSIKRKLFRKMKSTGDIKVPAAKHRYESSTRKRYSSDNSESTTAKSNTLSNSFKYVEQIHQSSSPNAPRNSNGDKVINEMSPHKEQYSKVDTELSEFQNDVPNDVKVSNEEKIRDIDTKIKEKSKSTILVEKKVLNEKEIRSAGKSFIRKANSLGDIKSRAKESTTLDKWKSSRSAGDLGKASKRYLLPLERKQKSKTSSSSLIRMLNPKVKAGSYKATEGSHPTVVMDGFQAAGALLAMFVPINSSEDNGLEIDNVREMDKLDVNNNENKVDRFISKSKYSLGSVFGDRSTVVKYALTEACDVLTAAVTPTIDETEVMSRVSRKNKNDLEQNDPEVPSLVKNEKTVTKSKKKKRAPEPHKSVIKPHLFAATQLITAVVHQDFGQTSGGLTEGTANEGSSLYAGSSCRNNDSVYSNSTNNRQTECQFFSDKGCQKSDKVHEENKTTQVEKNMPKLKETTTNFKNTCEHSGVRESEIVFENKNKIHPCQNLTLHPESSNNIFLTPQDTLSGTEIKSLNYKNIAHLKKNVPQVNKNERPDLVLQTDNTIQNTNDNSGRKLDNANIDRYIESDIVQGSKHSFRKVKVPPPSYPPPPLRPWYSKKQKQKQFKEKQPKIELGGMIGNAIISSGQMLGVVADTAVNNAVSDRNLFHETNKHKRTVFDRRRDSEAEIPKQVDHDYINLAGTFRKFGETGRSMTERRNGATNARDEHEPCEICSDIMNTETIQSCKNDRSDLNDTLFAPFKRLTLADDVLSPNACSCLHKQKSKRQPETLNKMLMTSCDLLTAFVTSNQETKQAFEAFVGEKCGINDQQNIASNVVDLNHETEHDYVNVSRL